MDLDSSLRDRGGALIVRRGEWVPAVTGAAKEAGASVIHVADDYSGYAQRRLARLETAAAAEQIEIRRHPGVTLAEPGALAPASGQAYQVFGPYYQRWRTAPMRQRAATPRAITLPPRIRPGNLPTLTELTTASPAPGRPDGGERAALARLRAWADGGLAGYASDRDMLAADGISRLSPYLHLGCPVAARRGG